MVVINKTQPYGIKILEINANNNDFILGIVKKADNETSVKNRIIARMNNGVISSPICYLFELLPYLLPCCPGSLYRIVLLIAGF